MDEEASSGKSASDEDDGVHSKDVRNGPEDLSVGGHGDSDNFLDEGLGRELNHDGTTSTRARPSAIFRVSRSKHATSEEIGECLPEASFELQTSDTAGLDRPWKSKNVYSRVRVSNDARVHLGDSITVNNHYCTSSTEKEEHTVARIEVTEEFLMTLLAAFTLVKELLKTATGLLVLLQVTMSGYRLPKQIGEQLAVFEDALGRFERIDLRFLDSWLAFQQRLESNFQQRPGSRRVLNMSYRLCDRSGGKYMFDPRSPPPFAAVFKQGRHVQMSIHFEWNEVSDKQCPRCELEQGCSADHETICIRCGFVYRSEVEDARVEEVEDDGETPVSGDPAIVRRAVRRRFGQRDTPSSFSRITISKPPAAWDPPTLRIAEEWLADFFEHEKRERRKRRERRDIQQLQEARIESPLHEWGAEDLQAMQELENARVKEKAEDANARWSSEDASVGGQRSNSFEPFGVRRSLQEISAEDEAHRSAYGADDPTEQDDTWSTEGNNGADHLWSASSHYGLPPQPPLPVPFPEYLQRAYAESPPAHNRPSARGNRAAQPNGHASQHNTKSDADDPINPSIALSTPSYTLDHDWSPYPPEFQEMPQHAANPIQRQPRRLGKYLGRMIRKEGD